MKVNVCVTVCYSKTVELDVCDNFSEVDLNRAAREQLYNMHSFMDREGWNEDEFDVTVE